jgi:hypothetical protein
VINIDHALRDKRMLGAALDDIGTWATWRVAMKAAFGLPLDTQERATFAAIAGERAPLRRRVRELWCVAGRRSGKSRMSAAIAVYQALFVKHRLAQGERGMVLVIAGSMDQAKTVFGYIKGFLDAAPALSREVASSTANEITLKNRIVIGVHSNSFRTVRGRTLVAAILDEVSFWRDETSATPDVEVYRAVMPSLVNGGMLVGISTPYRKLGLLHQKHRDHFGQDGDVLVVQGASRSFNPSLSEAAIAAQRAADPTAALSEWDAEFRSDIGAFLDDDLIDGAVAHGRPLELPPLNGVQYRAFTDASGGVGADAYTLAIGHMDGECCVADLVRGTSGKFDPYAVTKEYAALCKEYRCVEVTGDAYAREWVAGTWRAAGIGYRKSPLPKSEIYLECIPLFTRGLVALPDHARLLRELRLLERRAHRGGKDSVDHPKGGRDDHANAVCGVLHLLAGRAARMEYMPHLGWREIPDEAPLAVPIIIGGSDYPARPAYEAYINPDGTIRSTPRGRFP